MKRRIFTLDEQYDRILAQLADGPKVRSEIDLYGRSVKMIEVRLNELLQTGEIVIIGTRAQVGRGGTHMRVYAINDGSHEARDPEKLPEQFRRETPLPIETVCILRMLDDAHRAGVMATRGAA